MSGLSLRVQSGAPRLDRFLADLHPDIPRNKWDAWIKGGQLRVNGETVTKGGTKLRAGDLIEGPLPELAPPAQHLEPEDLPVPTLFEDDRLWIVDKPSGMVVHPGPAHPGGTIVNALLFRLQATGHRLPEGLSEAGSPPIGAGARPGDPVEPEAEEDSEEAPTTPWPGLVHRLDRYTTGCMALTKDAEAQRNLQAQFKARTVEKRYLALV
ncbi:MAG TPA: RluA family pseudouridine synthase, partial [Holophagaceae bacterium]|nr:RluA family pseudouridine synthase [Holophagaceae bacterium]